MAEECYVKYSSTSACKDLVDSAVDLRSLILCKKVHLAFQVTGNLSVSFRMIQHLIKKHLKIILAGNGVCFTTFRVD